MPDLLMAAIDQLHLPRTLFGGQTVLVTGSGQGIGKAAAQAFASLGAKVVIAEISPLGEGTAHEIALKGDEAFFFQVDVSDPDSVASLARQVQAQLGGLDILVNNAILCPAASVSEMAPELWNRVIAVNLTGAFLTCHAFLPGMLARKRGIIINMVSTEAVPGLSAYIASKQGITGFTQSLAAEVGENGLHAIAFAPGMVDTPGIRAVAVDLAPRLGMSLDQFLSLSIHPAYDGYMPCEHAGLATACLAAYFAEEFHGEVVTGYTILERAGLITPASAQSQPPGEAPLPAAFSEERDPAADLEHARALTNQVLEELVDTGRTFNRLPVFVRPMARSGFKSSAGASLGDWQNILSALQEALADAEKGEPSALIRFRREHPEFNLELARLRDYFAAEPAQAARFSKDQEFLAEAARIAGRRVAAVAGLIQALSAV